MRRLLSVRSQVSSRPKYTITSAETTITSPLAASTPSLLSHGGEDACACSIRTACTTAATHSVSASALSAELRRKSGSLTSKTVPYRCSAKAPAANTITRVSGEPCAPAEARQAPNASVNSSQSSSAGTRHSWRA